MNPRKINNTFNGLAIKGRNDQQRLMITRGAGGYNTLLFIGGHAEVAMRSAGNIHDYEWKFETDGDETIVRRNEVELLLYNGIFDVVKESDCDGDYMP